MSEVVDENTSNPTRTLGEDNNDYKYINNYYSVNREKALEYSSKYYRREGMKEKRSEYNKKYYQKMRKYIVCKKCKIPILEHNYRLHEASFTHINGRRPKKPSEFKINRDKYKSIKIEEAIKPPLLDKIEIYV